MKLKHSSINISGRSILLKFAYLLLGLILTAGNLVSCKSNDDNEPEDYTEWHARNVAFIEQKQQERDEAGKPVYDVVRPVFAPSVFSLMRWHNDKFENLGNLVPMDNSTVKVNYRVSDIDGTLLDQGANTNFQPCNTVVGFWTALTNMHVGDTVTAIVPFEAGYGNVANGNIKPYTTLIFSIRLKEIIGYEIKH